MGYLPLFVDLKNMPVLVIGGGTVAARKVRMLYDMGAEIRIVADKLCSKLDLMLFTKKEINWIGKKFCSSMLENVTLVITATNDEELNNLVFWSAKKRYILINTVDDQKKCSFIFPAIVNRSPIMIGISSGGASPVLVRMLREKFESLLPKSIGFIAEFARRWRCIVKQHIFDLKYRRKFWEKIFLNNQINMLVYQGRIKDADHLLKTILSTEKNNFNQKNRGYVTLVGSGPGDSSLLTLGGLQAIQQADVVLHDYLVSTDIIELIRRDANIICVGKKSGQCLISQKEINQLMVQLAKQGNNVVRLKGGDPFVFGRGAEELLVLSKFNIPFHVVPGITSGVGVTSYAGIPLTHRECSHGVIFLTGHEIGNIKSNWRVFLNKNITLVIYMGKNNLNRISKILISYGKEISTPIALISRGTYRDQQVLVGTLIELEKLAEFAMSPTLLVIGEVVKFHRKIFWFNQNIWNINKFSSILKLQDSL